MGCDGGEDVDLFVADGVGVDEWLPGAVLPCIDAVVLDALAFVEPFHGDGAVECDGLVEVDFQYGVAGWGGPEGGGVVVDCGCGSSELSDAWPDSATRLCCVEAMNGCAELLKAFYVGVGDAAGVVGCEAEHELGAAADGVGVDVEEFIDGC